METPLPEVAPAKEVTEDIMVIDADSFSMESPLAEAAPAKEVTEDSTVIDADPFTQDADDYFIALKLQLSEAGAEDPPSEAMKKVAKESSDVSVDLLRDSATAHELVSSDMKVTLDSYFSRRVATEELGLFGGQEVGQTHTALLYHFAMVEDCKICFDSYNSKHLFSAGSCGHMFCLSCWTSYLSASAKEGRKYPFSCPTCGEALEDNRCLQLVAGSGEACHELQRVIVRKKYCSQIRYCANPECSAAFDWIIERGDPSKESMVHCPLCGTFTCAKCKSLWHEGMTCEEFTSGNDENGLAALADQLGWTACPECGHMIDRRRGDCNFVTCICGCGFCHKCGKAYESLDPEPGNVHGKPGCECGLFDLQGRQRLAIVRDEGAGDADHAERRNAVEREVYEDVAEQRGNAISGPNGRVNLEAWIGGVNGFVLSRRMRESLEKRICPYPECRAAFGSLQALAQHLISVQRHKVYLCCERPFYERGYHSHKCMI